MDALNEIANQILRINIAKLKKNATAVRSDLDPEAVHEMRIAIRRLRAALATFKKILPAKARKIQARLEKWGAILGKMRDLDIFGAFILQVIYIDATSIPKLTRQREQSQKQMVSKLDTKAYARLMKSLERLKTKKTAKNLQKFSKAKLQKALHRVMKIAPCIDVHSDDKTLHKLRISIKKLRYNCEFFEPVFSQSACPLGTFIERTKHIQDIIGEHQDSIVGIYLLRRHKHLFSKKAFLQIHERYASKKKQTRAAFFKIWTRYCAGLKLIKLHFQGDINEDQLQRFPRTAGEKDQTPRLADESTTVLPN